MFVQPEPVAGQDAQSVVKAEQSSDWCLGENDIGGNTTNDK